MTLRGWASPLFTIAILLSFLCLSGIRLDQEAYWADEIFTLRIAEAPWPEFWNRVRIDATNPPLHYILVKLIRDRGGEFLLHLRWLSIFVSALCLLVICRGGYLVAALIVSVNAWFIHYSQEVRAYALISLGVALLLNCLEKNRPSWLLLLSVAGLVWSHYYGVLYVLAALAVYRRRWKPMLLGLATLLPWLLFVASQFLSEGAGRHVGWIPKATPAALFHYFSRLLIGWPNMLFGLTLLVLLLFLLVLAWRRRDERQLLWLCVALLPPLVMFLLSQIPFLGLHFFFYRYFLASMIPVAILLSEFHARSNFIAIPLALLISLPFTLSMRSESARFDSIRVARELQSEIHPPVYAWDFPFNAAPINLYCKNKCVEDQPKSIDQLPKNFWLLSWPEDRDLTELDWRRATRSRGYTTRSIRLYPKRRNFQLHSLEIVEYSRP